LTATRIIHRDFDVRGGSGGDQVIAPYVEAQDEKGIGNALWRTWVFRRAARTMVADLTGKLLPMGIADSHRDEFEDLFGMHSIDQTGDSPKHECRSSAGECEPRVFWVTRRDSADSASDTKYSWSQRSKTGPYARAAGITRVMVM